VNTKLPEKRGSVLLSWVIPFAVGALITFLVYRYRSGFAYADLKGDRTLACLSDGAFVAGVILLGVGILVWVSTTGFFDMLAYGMRGLGRALLPFLGLRKHENYYEYKQEKAEKRHPITAAVPVSGIFWLLLGGLFLTLALR
jgi:hypothetical protein